MPIAALIPLSIVAGLIVGAIIVYAAPRLVACRLEDPIPLPSFRVLVPLAGPWLEREPRSWSAGPLEEATVAVPVGVQAESEGLVVEDRNAGSIFEPEGTAEPAPTVVVPREGAASPARIRATWSPLRAVLVELATAVAFVALSLKFGASLQLLLAALYSALLIAIAYVDIDYRLVLNRLSYPGILLALAASPLWPGIGIENALLGAGVGLLLFGLLEILGRGALGTGDTKLAILIGAMRGFPGAINALLLGTILGGLGAIFFLIVLRRGRKSYIAYAPYLAAGAIISFFLIPQ